LSTLYLIPSLLSEDAVDCIPSYLLDAVKSCKVIFAENERTTRRFLKKLDKSIVIDDFEWHTIHKAEQETIQAFRTAIQSNKNIAIISEAGCPGIADPGQYLIAEAQRMKCLVKPLVGPSSILLALMASGMNGQHFEFVGYLPVDPNERNKKIKELELSSEKNGSTKIFIETPYRNQAMLDSILKQCQGKTNVCIGIDITGSNESVLTKSVTDWKKSPPILPKIPVIFLIQA
jgi:16S rRNA (cytidine1402-2'-O)-methyltransferase